MAFMHSLIEFLVYVLLKSGIYYSKINEVGQDCLKFN